MKIPLKPPRFSDLFNAGLSHPGRLRELMHAKIGPAPGGKYRHWDTLRHARPVDGFSPSERWLAMKMARQLLYQTLPLRDLNNEPFQYGLPGAALQMLHQIDRLASGNIAAAPEVTDPQTRDTYLIKSIIEEAITSSQLEGAATTRNVAKTMIQEGRPPRTRSERMILNNYEAMHFIRRVRDQPLTPAVILELHSIITLGTLKNPDAAGRLREADDIYVTDSLGALLHKPPLAAELKDRVQELCDFANDSDSREFLHPVIRAILLHLWLAYDHPFEDGNGRTARALFYWAMAVQGYWLCEYLSISRILKKAPSQYARAFLYTETDDNDATYFILYQLNVIIRAIQELHDYLARKTAEIHETEQLIRRSRALQDRLNHRQLALMNHAMRNQGARYTVQSHQRSHNVSDETARNDLLALSRDGLLDKRKVKRTLVFTVPSDLKERLSP